MKNSCIKYQVFIFLCIMITVLFSSCSFSGEAPKIMSASISDGQRISAADRIDEISISFSVPMNRYITENNISISGYYGSTHFQWNNSNSTVRLLLGEPFEEGKAYTLEILAGCESAGGYDLGEDISYKFYTYTNESDFFVVSTSPGDGETITERDGAEIVIEFSRPIRYTTIYDKISIQPARKYSYSFSSDRNIITLNILQHLESNQLYTVRIDKELGCLDGKALKEEYLFSFNTIESTQVFLVQEARMTDVSGSSAGFTLTFDNNNFPDVITGVEKDMELQVRFNTGFYLYTMKGTVAITPYISHSLEKDENNVLRVVLNEPMTPEETYTVTIDRSTSNIYGVTLDRDYAFEWTVNGQNSLFIRPAKISILTPEGPDSGDDDTGMQNTEILNENGIFHNLEMPYRFISNEACNLVRFEIQFSPVPDTGSPRNNIDVFRSILYGFVYYDTS